MDDNLAFVRVFDAALLLISSSKIDSRSSRAKKEKSSANRTFAVFDHDCFSFVLRRFSVVNNFRDLINLSSSIVSRGSSPLLFSSSIIEERFPKRSLHEGELKLFQKIFLGRQTEQNNQHEIFE